MISSASLMGCSAGSEVVVRQMLKKIRIEENGDSDFLPGTMVDTLDFEDTKIGRASCRERV